MSTTSLSFPDSEVISASDEQATSFLRDKIAQLAKVKARSSTLLFSSKNKEYTNFHEFFDKKANLLLLIRLRNKTVVGGFSREEFQPGCAGNYGFLFSLSRLEAYERIKGSTIVYDPDAIVFGRCELKIKNKSINLYSNFGAYDRNFHSYSKDVHHFIGNQDSKYAEMAAFEIWQLHTE
jgi:hypothetical protein